MTDEERREPDRPGPSEQDQPAEGGRDIIDDGTDPRPRQPEPGTDSRVEDWYGQSVARDAELADELTEQLGEQDAEREFERRATGREEQDARHGRQVDPDAGREAYQRAEGGRQRDSGGGSAKFSK